MHAASEWSSAFDVRLCRTYARIKRSLDLVLAARLLLAVAPVYVTADARAHREYAVAYVPRHLRRKPLAMDARILVSTIPAVLFCRGSR